MPIRSKNHNLCCGCNCCSVACTRRTSGSQCLSSAHMRGRSKWLPTGQQPNPPASSEGQAEAGAVVAAASAPAPAPAREGSQQPTTGRGRERSSRRAAARWGAPVPAPAVVFCRGAAPRTVAGKRGRGEGGTTAAASSPPRRAAGAGAGAGSTCLLGALCSSLPDAPAPSSPARPTLNWSELSCSDPV